MRIQYLTLTGDKVSMWMPPEGEYTPPEGFSYRDGNYEFPSEPMFYYRFDSNTNQIVRKPQQEIDEMIARQDFDVEKMSAGFAYAFDIATQSKMKSSFAVVQGYARGKLFTGEKSIRSFLQYEVDHDEMTDEEYETIRQVILQQGIDIGAL